MKEHYCDKQCINTKYSLVRHLKEISENDEKYKNLYASWTLDEEVYTNALKTIITSFPHYSMHDSTHSWSIINKIEMVLGEERIRSLSPTDTFLILESAFVHDLGMITTEKEQKELWKDIEFKKYIEDIINDNLDSDLVTAAKYIKDIEENGVGDCKDWTINVKGFATLINADYFRRRHNKRSANVIMASNELSILSSRNNLIPERIMRLIAQISIMHGTQFSEVLEKLYKEDNGIGNDTIHPRMIACLLRLGDLLDLDNGRFNETLEKIVFMPQSSIDQKDKHQAITHFFVSPKKIEVSAICSNHNVYRATRKWFEWLEEELKNLSSKWSDIVPDQFSGGPPSLGKIELRIKDCDLINEKFNLKFNIDQRVALNFIEGSGIYDNRLECIREVIQNALDATKIQMWIDLTNGKYDYIIGKLKITKESLGFSNYIPKILKSMYTIKITVDYSEETDEFIMSIDDKGCGITLKDLKRMEDVGESWNNDNDKYKLISSMPEWMKPTGSFGIGLHSIFMITDLIEIQTKAENNEAYNIKMSSSRENGYISIMGDSKRKLNGTNIIFRFKSEIIDEITFNYKNSNLTNPNEIYSKFDIVDSNYMKQVRKEKLKLLLEYYLSDINWVNIDICGIEEKVLSGDTWNSFDKESEAEIDDDLLIKITYNESKKLIACVNDKKNNAQIQLQFVDLLSHEIINKRYDLLRMLNLRKIKTNANNTISELFYKNIKCDMVEGIDLFKAKINIVNGHARGLLSVNRNKFIDYKFLEEYVDRINSYILKKVAKRMWDYCLKEKDLIQDIEVLLAFFAYIIYCDNSIDLNELEKNVVYKEWKIREAYKINNQEVVNATLQELLNEKQILIVDELTDESVKQAKIKNIKIIFSTMVDKEKIKKLGFNRLEYINEINNYIIASKDNNYLTNDNIYCFDYSNNEVIKYHLDKLRSNKCARDRIEAFKYINKPASKICYLFTEKEEIISPFPRNFDYDILQSGVDKCILELKEKYKFDELINYVYNNCLDIKVFDNNNYKQQIENGYKELISDYIKFHEEI